MGMTIEEQNNESENYIEKLEKDIKALQNRCLALSGGALCFFCHMDCDKRTTPYRRDVEEQEQNNE